jgi:hypothetical protein
VRSGSPLHTQPPLARGSSDQCDSGTGSCRSQNAEIVMPVRGCAGVTIVASREGRKYAGEERRNSATSNQSR